MLTRQLFDSIFPTKGLDPRKYNLVRERDLLVDSLNRILPKYGIDTYLRICAFLANCGIETDYFKTTIEYASGEAYEGRKDLGNTQPGDGRRFKGRDCTQTTGRSNYTRVNNTLGKKLGIDFLKHPERLAEVEIAVESACIFWRDHDLNTYADAGNFRALSGIVNRGDARATPLHWPKRNELYSKLKRYLPKDLQLGDEISQKVDNLSPSPIPIETKQLVSETNSPAEVSPVSFISDVVDKNVSPDQIKTASVSAGRRVWQLAIRPLSLLYAALEAGNIAAWLGVAVLVIAAGLLLYWHRADIKRLADKLKAKVTQ